MRVRLKNGLQWFKVVPTIAVAVVAATLLYATTPSAPPSEATPAKHEKIDPVKTNGAIFEGWPKPDVALIFTGELDGYLEPCGCAGLENQKGGLKRRFTMLKQLRDQNWPIIAVDAGGQEKDTGVQAGLKVEFAYQALTKMGYKAVGFGENDLKLDLVPIVINLDPKTNPLVAGNVSLSDLTKPFVIVNEGGMKIGITTVLGKKAISHLPKTIDFKLTEPYLAIPKYLAELRNAKCDHLVLLVNGEPDEAKDLANRFPEFDWVMATHDEEPPKEPATQPTPQKTTTHIVEVGHKGMYAVVVGFYKNGSPSFRYQRVPLDHRFADAPEIYKMQVDYLRKLEALGLSGLEIKSVPHESGRKFVGSKTCESCHTKAAEVFNKTPHATATETLLTKTDPPRIYDPECLSCHVTGWEPQKQFPFETGYLGLKDTATSKATPDLVGNGCENCHGPGARHAAVENGEVTVSDAEKKALRAELHLELVPNEGNQKGQEYDKGKVVQMCMQCHDLDNSPEFDFQKYWPKVKHVGKD